MSALERRRRSSLAGAHPAIPETPAIPARPAKAAGRVKITVELDGDVVEAAKNAWWAAHREGQVDKWAHFVQDALAAHTERIRNEVNGGEPLPSRPSRSLPPGRPMR